MSIHTNRRHVMQHARSRRTSVVCSINASVLRAFVVSLTAACLLAIQTGRYNEWALLLPPAQAAPHSSNAQKSMQKTDTPESASKSMTARPAAFVIVNTCLAWHVPQPQPAPRRCGTHLQCVGDMCGLLLQRVKSGQHSNHNAHVYCP